MKKIFFLLALLWCCGKTTLWAQVSAYSFSQTSGAYTPITGGTVIADGTAGLNTFISGNQSMPAFKYTGVTFSSFYVTGRGTVRFSGQDSFVIAPFESMLDGVSTSAASNIRYETVGNETIIQWTQFRRTGNTESFDFQVRLNHSTDAISFVYQLNSGPAPSGIYPPRVGIIASAADFNVRRILSGDWITSVAGTAYNSSCQFSGLSGSSCSFSSGLTYTWIPPSCPHYGGITATGLTANSVTISWQQLAGGSYLLEYGAAGFTPGSGNTPGAGGTIINPATSPYTIGGLAAETEYDVYYRRNCTASSNGYSANSQKLSFRTGYCTFSSDTSGYYIDSFSTTGGYSNITNNNSDYAPGGYQDASAMVVTQNRGDTLRWTLINSSAWPMPLSIWVDWDDDLLFEANEKIFQGLTSVTNYNYVIPATAPLGNHRMRVVQNRFSSFSGQYYPCGHFSTQNDGAGGEAEDYTLQVTNYACSRPHSLKAVTSTSATITLSWVATGTPVNNYDIYYSTNAAAPDMTTLPTLTNQLPGAVISGLAPSTTYYIWVRANCGAEQSSWGWRLSMATTCTETSNYFEDFGITGSVMPACFMPFPEYPGEAKVLNGQLYISNQSVVTLRPVSNAASNTHWLRFKPSGTSSIQVGYLTNPQNKNTFTLIQTVSTPNANAAYTVDPGALPAGITVLAFKGNGMIDSVYWEPKPLCLPPSNITVTHPSDTSIHIAWVNPAAMPSGNFDIYYSTANAAPNNGTTPVLTNQASGAVVGGLNASTTYYFWVRSNCAPGTSSWTAGGSMKTLCTPVTSFSENFDANMPDGFGAIALPACFERAYTGYNSPSVINQNASSPSNTLHFGNDVSLLKLRPVSNAGANTHWLRFKARAVSYPGNMIQAGYFTDPSDPASFTVLQQFTITSTDYQEFYVDPGTIPGTNTVLGLKGAGTINNTQAYMYVDDVVWEPKPACIFPYDVVAGTPTQTTNTISWSAIASQPPANNYDIYYSTDPTAPTMTTIPNETNQVSGTTISGLSPGTTYYVWVRSNCGATQTTWAGPDTFTTIYAPPVNDDASGAINLTLGTPCIGASYSNMGATTTAGEPYPSCSNNKVAPVWFKLIAPPSGAVRIYSTSGTAATAKMALFSATDSTDYSTFSLISCDGEGGSASGTLSNGANASVVYATGLTPGTTYYISFDVYTTGNPLGTFCLRADEFSINMLSATNNCGSGYQSITSFSTSYAGWYSLLDNNGNLLAMVRQPTGGSPNYFSAAQNVNAGAIRTDGNNTPYLDRNWYIWNTISTAATDVMLFFTDAEFQALKTADASINTLSDLFIVKVPHSAVTTCLSDFGTGQTNTVITPTGSGTSADGLVHWLSFTTSGFSNFFIKGGNSPLPVQLVDFNGRRGTSSNMLSWNFACDDNQMLKVALERNEDGKSKFMTIYQSEVNAANCGRYLNYEDKDLSGATHFYRLRYAAPDGNMKYSRIIALTNDTKAFELIDIMPNPAHDRTIIRLLCGSDNKGSFRITDIAGRVVERKAVMLFKGNNSIELNTGSYAPGLYIITVADESGNKRSVKLVKE